MDKKIKKSIKKYDNDDFLFLYNFYRKFNNFIKFKVNYKLRKVFILLPPPNITGKLHLGHILNFFIQDIIYRFYEMFGYEVIWKCALDHAGIATESKISNILFDIDKTISKKGKNKFFVQAIKEWYRFDKNIILNQIENLNIKLDVSKIYFTFSKKFNKEIFTYLNLFIKKKYIFFDNLLVNYCINCNTVLSDEEVIIETVNKKMFFLKYFFKNSSKYILVATTKPSTIIGDISILSNTINTNKLVKVPLVDRFIPIIKDSNNFLDENFGSGNMKLSPFFDHKDIEICKFYNLDISEIIIDFNNNLKILVSNFNNERFDINFQKKIINLLTDNNLIEKVENIQGKVYKCYRCNNLIQNIKTGQFFFDLKRVVNENNKSFLLYFKQCNFLNPKFANNINLFLKDIKNWCISRQITLGHKIKFKVCLKCNKIYSFDNLICNKCHTKLFYHNYVLDTWFSSALYHIILFPNNNINFLVTGFDIIFFWVFKMLIMSFLLNKTHFKYICLHGIIRDKNNKKLSKSLNNSPDISSLLVKYNSDIIRISFFLKNNPMMSDIRFSENELLFYQKLFNKKYSMFNFLYKDINKNDIKDYIINFFKKIINIKCSNIMIIFYFFYLFYDLCYLNIKKMKKSNFNISFYLKQKYLFLTDYFSSKLLEFVKIFNISKYFIINLWNLFFLHMYPFIPYHSNLFLKRNNIKFNIINFFINNNFKKIILFSKKNLSFVLRVFYFNIILDFLFLFFNKIKHILKFLNIKIISNSLFNKKELFNFLHYYKIQEKDIINPYSFIFGNIFYITINKDKYYLFKDIFDNILKNKYDYILLNKNTVFLKKYNITFNFLINNRIFFSSLILIKYFNFE